MGTLYYHAGAGAAAAARGLGVLDVRGDDCPKAKETLRTRRFAIGTKVFAADAGGTGAVQRACLAHASAR